MPETQLSLFESRLIDGLTFRTTTDIVSVAAGGTLILHLSHSESDGRSFLIQSIKFSSNGPIEVRTYSNPDSVTVGTPTAITSNTSGELITNDFDSLKAYTNSSFTGEDVQDSLISGSTVGNTDPGSGGDTTVSLVPGGDYLVELTNTDTNPHNSTLTITGALV